MVTELALTLLLTGWAPMQMWLLYKKYNLFYFLPKPLWFGFSLPSYYLCLKIKLCLTIKDWFANFTKIRKKWSAKLSKWIANRVSRTVNSNPGVKLYKSGETGAVLIDLSKAFNFIDHNLLIAKLDGYRFEKQSRVPINFWKVIREDFGRNQGKIIWKKISFVR